MIYIPKSIIDRNILECTRPDKLFDRNGYTYIGFYILQNGVPYSSDKNGNIIEQLYRDSAIDYISYKQLNTDDDNYIIKQFLPKPNKKDYENGNITRYFLKRKFSTDIDIIEVSSNVYNQLKGLNNAVTHLYDFFELLWVIIGNKEEVRKTNFIAVQDQEKEYTGINRYLSNLIQFWKLK